MNPPSILLDVTFLTGVADTDDSNHDDAVAIYRVLIDEFVAQRCLLVARADHLAAVANAKLFGPIEKVHVARQHRNAAAELAHTGVEIDLALTLVLIQRSKIRKVATFDERLDRYEIDNVAKPTSNVVGPDGVSMSPATTLDQ